MGNMGSTRRGWTGALFAAVFLVLGHGLYPQSAAPTGQLGVEIQRLEQRLAQAGISSAERHDASARLARLLQLSGDIAGAAARWLDAAAAAAVAGPQDDEALVAGAFCLAAVGEWERSLLTIRPLLASSRRDQPTLQARYLDTCLRARISGNVSALAGLAQDPEFASLHPLIYYTLWQISTNAESWRTRLIAEFPNSPEARAADTGMAGASISAVQSPLWMLFPGTGELSPLSPAADTSAAGNGAAGRVLQTGVFSRETNARSQADALRRAGFSATVSRKMAGSAENWTVTVPAGQDANRTIQELKRAGFDSFPVRNN